MSSHNEPADLTSRVFKDWRFPLAWIPLLFSFLIFVSEPIRRFLLVVWFYGSDAYFQRGIRALSVKPPRFSNGELVPIWMDCITGMGTFLVTTLGLSLLLFLGLRFYERLLLMRGDRPES